MTKKIISDLSMTIPDKPNPDATLENNEQNKDDIIIKLNKDFGDLSKKVLGFEKDFKIKLSDFKNEINSDKSALYTIFGIFATIITFLGTEIQIIKNTCNLWNILGMSFLLVGGLLSFIFFLQYVFKGVLISKETTSFKNEPLWGSIKDTISSNILLILCTILFFGTGISGLVKGQGQEDFCRYKTTDEIKSYIDENYFQKTSVSTSNCSEEINGLRLNQIEDKLINIQNIINTKN